MLNRYWKHWVWIDATKMPPQVGQHVSVVGKYTLAHNISCICVYTKDKIFKDQFGNKIKVTVWTPVPPCYFKEGDIIMGDKDK